MQQSGTLSDFMQQLPAPVIGIFVLFAIMLVLSTSLIIYFRLRGGSKNKPQNSGSGLNLNRLDSLFGMGGRQSPPPQASRSSSQTDPDDMPDLDTLLAMTAPDVPAPAQSPLRPNTAAETAPNPAAYEVRQPGTVIMQLRDGRQADATEVMVIARDRMSDNLIVQIGDYVYDGTETAIDAEFSRRFSKLLRELSEISPALSQGQASKVPPPPAPPPAQGQNAPRSLFNDRKKPQTAKETPDDQLDLAGQIEQYLQKKLAVTPAFKNRDIHVSSKPGGEVEIEVDGQYFNSVGDVSDAEVRQFLLETIAEWQAR